MSQSGKLNLFEPADMAAHVVPSKPIGEPVLRVVRGENTESIHYGVIAVVDLTGRVTHSLGNRAVPFMTRSSIKPFQLLPLVRTGAADKYGFSTRQLAIMCGSHNGTDLHRETTLSNLTLAGLDQSYLQCGSHTPEYRKLANQPPQDGEDKDALRHNCSGKHSGFLAFAKFLGDDPRHYLERTNKSQTLVREAIAEMCGVEPSRMPWGVDGCSAPNYALPVENLAIGFMRLASGIAGDDLTRKSLARIRAAMQEYPEMVSGEGRFDLALMRSFPGNVVCKIGAESIEGIGFSNPPIGISVKIVDGAKRALEPVCIEVLRQLGLFPGGVVPPELARWVEPTVKNYRGITTGSLKPDFTFHTE